MKVPETVSSGITVFTNSLLLPNPGVDHAIIYTDTRLFRSVPFRFVSSRLEGRYFIRILTTTYSINLSTSIRFISTLN